MEDKMFEGEKLIEGGGIQYYLSEYPFMGIDFFDDMSTRKNTVDASHHKDAAPEECQLESECKSLKAEIAEL